MFRRTRLDQGHATFMPDAIWTVSRPPSRLIPGHPIVTGFDIIHSLSTRHQWFTRVRLLGPHLTRVPLPFPSTLTTRALLPSQLEAVWNLLPKTVPRGPPSSLAQHRTPYRSLGRAFMAHTGRKIHTSRSEDGNGRCRNFATSRPCRSLPPFTPQSTITSISTVISTAAPSTRRTALPHWPSGVN